MSEMYQSAKYGNWNNNIPSPNGSAFMFFVLFYRFYEGSSVKEHLVSRIRFATVYCETRKTLWHIILLFIQSILIYPLM